MDMDDGFQVSSGMMIEIKDNNDQYPQEVLVTLNLKKKKHASCLCVSCDCTHFNVKGLKLP